MNKVVTTRMLAADLPEAARGDIDPASTVEVTVAEVAAGASPEGHFSRHFATRRASYASVDAVLAHVRAVREGDGPSGP